MTDYQRYINALRKCAKEHENDRTSTGHIIVSDLCRDTANLLKTLEQQPCEDCISRQAVLDEINEVGVKGFETYNDYSQLYDFVDTLPSVTPKGKIGWIPVTEGLPEESKRYVIFTKYNDVMTDFYTGERFLQGDDILAWMPLPEPYKAESEDKE